MSKIKEKLLKGIINNANRIVRKSSKFSLKYFGKTFKIKYKKGNSPFSVADLRTENYIIEEINKIYPKHSVLAEESGYYINDNEFKWIIDPIDGTKNYIRNNPFWGTLIALEFEGEIMYGAIYLPVLNEFFYAAKGKGCYLNGRKIAVSKINKIENLFLLFGGINYIREKDMLKGLLQISKKAQDSRGFGDCHGHTMIIRGNAELMIDPHVAPYDIAATKICIEEAGGILTDRYGNNSIYNGTAIISNGKFHEKILEWINI